MSTTFFQHAIDCGINMTGKLALPLEESIGHLVMSEVIDPETREVVIPTGIIMDMQLADVAASYGVDYVVVYKGPPTTVATFLDSLDHYPTCELMAALHSAVLHSNGLDFCERDTMLELAVMLRMEAVRRGTAPSL